MPRVRSAKGKVIDFDLLKIKRQIAGKPITIDVTARQNFIDQKARRRLRKVTKQATAAIAVGEQALAGVGPPDAQPIIAQPQVVDVTAKHVDDVKPSKQKVRPPRE